MKLRRIVACLILMVWLIISSPAAAQAAQSTSTNSSNAEPYIIKETSGVSMQVNKTSYTDWILSGLGVVFIGGAALILVKRIKNNKKS